MADDQGNKSGPASGPPPPRERTDTPFGERLARITGDRRFDPRRLTAAGDTLPPGWWDRALRVLPDDRVREARIAEVLRPVLDGAVPDFHRYDGPDDRRRLGYLVDQVQHTRGQTPEEGAALAAVRQQLPLPSTTFWPDEPPLPAGTDFIAERWNYTRGINCDRFRRALREPGFNRLLPPGGDPD